MKIIDAHIHLDTYDDIKREEIINSMEEFETEAIITVSMNLPSSKNNLRYKLSNRCIYPAFGFHPEQEIPSNEEIENLFEWIHEHKEHMIAVGEVGLPYYRNLEQQLNYEPYIKLLTRFIKLANDLNKPIVLHAVYEDANLVCDLLEQHSIKKAHFHWFKGGKTTIERMIENGYYISITPDVLYEEEIQELVKLYPLELMMVETDGPWPFEGRFEGKYTHPSFIHDSVQKISEIKGMECEAVYRTLFKNTKDFYEI